MSTKITTHYFEWRGRQYFRGNAHLVEPGSFGTKRHTIGIKAYIEPAGTIKPEHLDGRLTFNTRATIDWSTVSRGDLQAGADLNFLSLGQQGALSFEYSQARSAKLELIKLSIDETPLICVLNDAGVARDFLAREGGDGRVVSEYWVVVEAALAEAFAASGGVGIKAYGSHAQLTISGGAMGSQTVNLSPGTTFAYTLHRVTRWSKGKDSVEAVEADYKGKS